MRRMGWPNATPENVRPMLDRIGHEWAIFADIRDKVDRDKQLAEMRRYIKEQKDLAAGSSAGGHLKDVSRDRHLPQERSGSDP